jgi:predicted acylesterase/phospholipase RssA
MSAPKPYGARAARDWRALSAPSSLSCASRTAPRHKFGPLRPPSRRHQAPARPDPPPRWLGSRIGIADEFEVLQRIAEEYGKGRLLLISTTNLDSGKLVVWNIGAIAASENPDRLELVRKIILASAAVPGLFPPVMIDATLKDGRHQEMHVDGGTVSQMFLYPPSLDMAAIIKAFANRKARPAAYIVRNGRVSPQPEEVERGTLQIAGRAITTMIASNAVGELYRIYTTTQRDHIDFMLALIEDDFAEPYKLRFDHGYMSKLFAYGRAKGVAGYAWQTVPPGYARTSQ